MIPNMSPSEYVGSYPKASTRRSMTNNLKRYLQYVTGQAVVDLDIGWFNYLQDASPNDVIPDLISFCDMPGVSRLTPLTIRMYIATARGYLLDACDITLSPLQRRLMQRKFPGKPHPVTIDAEPERSMWRDILIQCDIRTTAALLIALSGCLRIGEIVGLRHNDVDLTCSPAVVHVPAAISKNDIPRTTYISSEAVDALRLYYRVRESYIKYAQAVSQGYSLNDELIFPFKSNSEIARLNRATSRAGYGEQDPITGRRRVHFHLARKFFITEAKTAAHPEFVEAWAGHAGYLSSAYHRPTAKRDRAEYVKAEPALLINVPDDYVRIKVDQANEIVKLQTASADQQHVINRLLDELQQLRHQQELIAATQLPGIRIRDTTQDNEYQGM